jgi:hypothetical protein
MDLTNIGCEGAEWIQLIDQNADFCEHDENEEFIFWNITLRSLVKIN